MTALACSRRCFVIRCRRLIPSVSFQSALRHREAMNTNEMAPGRVTGRITPTPVTAAAQVYRARRRHYSQNCTQITKKRTKPAATKS